MSANNRFLDTTQLDFNELKQSLRTFLEGQNQFRDYDFEGSNLSVLLDLLTYNTVLNSHYLNMIGSEMFLDSAAIKHTVVSHAKELNYVPRSAVSASVTATITIIPGDSPASITIPAGYAIKTMIDGITYNFRTIEPVTITPNGGQYVANNVTFYEGEIVTEIFTVSNPQNEDGSYASYRYPLSSENIDINSIRVSVRDSVGDTDSTIFERRENLFGVEPLDPVFWIEGFSADQYQLTFGTGVIGRPLVNGNYVTVTYRDTVGSLVNGARSFTKTSAIDQYNNIAVTINQPASGGAARETIDQIKFNAPRYFQTQQRAVIATDYDVLIRRKFPQIQSVAAFGGENVEPKQYGKIVISVKPYGTTAIVTDTLKQQIANYARQLNITTEPVIVDPLYFYGQITSTVQYDSSRTTKTPNDIRTKIINDLVSLNQTTLGQFDDDLYYNRIVELINSSDISIVTHQTNTRMIRRWSPRKNIAETIIFTFGNRLAAEPIPIVHPPGWDSVIISTPFVFRSAGGQLYTSQIQDDGTGILRIFTQTNTGFLTVADNIGTVDYQTGAVTITTTVTDYAGNSISLAARTASRNLLVTNNQFLLIEPSDISVTVTDV